MNTPQEDAPPVKKIIRVSPKTIQDNYTKTQEGRADECKPAIVVEALIHGKDKPGQFFYPWAVEIQGPSRVVHDEKNPLLSGTRVWIETTAQCEMLMERPQE